MFRKNIEKNCLYCAYGSKLSTNDDILCDKCGITAIRTKCAKFRYSPLKRIPVINHVQPGGFSASDFSITD